MTGMFLNSVYKFSPYLTGNTLHLSCKDQPVNRVKEIITVSCRNHTKRITRRSGENAEIFYIKSRLWPLGFKALIHTGWNQEPKNGCMEFEIFSMAVDGWHALSGRLIVTSDSLSFPFFSVVGVEDCTYVYASSHWFLTLQHRIKCRVHVILEYILSRDCDYNGCWIGNRIYCTVRHTTRNYKQL
jgi:hypothetical protein